MISPVQLFMYSHLRNYIMLCVARANQGDHTLNFHPPTSALESTDLGTALHPCRFRGSGGRLPVVLLAHGRPIVLEQTLKSLMALRGFSPDRSSSEELGEQLEVQAESRPIS